jgi:hypothetical protein
MRKKISGVSEKFQRRPSAWSCSLVLIISGVNLAKRGTWWDGRSGSCLKGANNYVLSDYNSWLCQEPEPPGIPDNKRISRLTQ